MNFLKLFQLISHSSQVICMDANLSNKTIKIVESIRSSFTSSDKLSISSYNYLNTHKPNKDYKYDIALSKDHLLSDMDTKIKNGYKIALAVSNARIGLCI